MALMVMIPHYVIDDRVCIFGAFVCQMKIDHGGLQAAVAQVLQDHAQVDAGLQQVRGITVAPMPSSA